MPLPIMMAAGIASTAAHAIGRLRHKKVKVRRRRHRYLTSKAKEELEWVARHLGKTAASERIHHFGG